METVYPSISRLCEKTLDDNRGRILRASSPTKFLWLLDQRCFCGLKRIHAHTSPNWSDHQPAFLIGEGRYYTSSGWPWCGPCIACTNLQQPFCSTPIRKEHVTRVGCQAYGWYNKPNVTVDQEAWSLILNSLVVPSPNRCKLSILCNQDKLCVWCNG